MPYTSRHSPHTPLEAEFTYNRANITGTVADIVVGGRMSSELSVLRVGTVVEGYI